MSINQRPGVYISETTVTSVAVADTPSDALASFVGQTQRGPTQSGLGVPTLINSWTQFNNLFGGFANTALDTPFAVWQFFNNGGAMCWVTRAIGAGAVAASKTISDTNSTPQSTITLTALNEGSWGNNLYAEIVARSTGRFDLRIYYGGTVQANIVETFTDLSMQNTDARYAQSVVNSIGNGSSFVKFTDNNVGNWGTTDTPVVGVSTAFINGADGNPIGNTDISNAVNQLNMVDTAMTLNLPGISNVTQINAAIAYCEGRGDVFLVIDCTAGQTPAAAVTEQATFTASTYAGYYYPRLIMNDPSSSVTGATRTTAPGGVVLGIIANTDHGAGAWHAPAGLRWGKTSGAFALERKLSNTDLDTLNTSYVNAIRNHPVGGICVFGARTLSHTTSVRYIPVRRELIYLKDNIKRIVSPFLFENNDAPTWLDVTAQVTQFLTNQWNQGGLVGATSDQAFYVICDNTVNTPTTIAAGELHVTVGVALQSPTEFIVINIGQWQGGTSVFES